MNSILRLVSPKQNYDKIKCKISLFFSRGKKAVVNIQVFSNKKINNFNIQNFFFKVPDDMILTVEELNNMIYEII